MGLFWPIPEVGHPGTPRLYEGGQFSHPDGKARFHGVPYRPPAEVVDDEYPVWLTTGRVVSQYLSGTQTRRIAASSSSTPSRCARCTPSSPSRSASPTATWSPSRSRRGEITLPAARRQHHPARHRVHPVPLARRQGREPADHPGGRPAVEDARVQGRRRARGARRPRRPTTAT